MTAEILRKVKAILLIAMTAGAEVRQVRQEVRLNAGRSVPAMKTGGARGDSATNQMDALMKGMFADSNLQGPSRQFAEQIEAMLADPKLQEQGEAFAERINALKAEQNLETQANLFAKEIEALEADPNFQRQEKQFAKRMDTIMADPSVQKQTEQMEALKADPKLQEQAKLFAEQMMAQAKTVTEQMEDGKAAPDMQDQAKLIADQVRAFMGQMMPGLNAQEQTVPNFDAAKKEFAEQMEAMMGDPKLQEEANLGVEQMQTLQADPEFQKQEQDFANKLQATMADPNFQKQTQKFIEMTQGGSNSNPVADQLRTVAEKMETLMTDPNFSKQAEHLTQQMEAMMAADPKLQEQAERVGAQMEAMMGSLTEGLDSQQDQAGDAEGSTDDLVDGFVDKLFDRVTGASSRHEGLDKTTLGKSATLASPASRQAPHSVFPSRSPSTSRVARGGGLKRHIGIPLTRTSGRPSLTNPIIIRSSGAVPVPDSNSMFGKLRANLGLTKAELKKMVPLTMIFFNILFCYTVLRDTKDVLVVTSGGAEVIPFLKTYMNLPAAMAFTVLYSSMVNKMSNKKVFYTLISCFAIFFGSFATIIYPNSGALHPIAWANNAAASLPKGFAPIISIIKFWTFGTFYTFAELWGSVVVSVLFWGFANEISSVAEAKRWYPLFGLIANVALIFSGQFIRYVSSVRANLPPGIDPWGYSLNILMAAVVTGAGFVLGLYWYMQNYVLTDPEVMPQNMEKKGPKKKKPSMSLGDSFKYLLSSSYIRNLAFLVIAYGTSINIVEVSWKGKLKQAFPGPNEYSSFMGAFSSTTGAVTLVMMIVGRWILNRFGWGTAALVTPIMLGITGVSFFSLILFSDSFAPLTAMMGLTPLMMAVLMGAAQNILSKSSKYSLFDPCKETAYIPLDAEMRTKGKAAIDVIGNPLGKSGGAFIQQGALLCCGSLAASTPFLGGVLFVMVGLWISAARSLAVEFEEKAAEMDAKSEDDDTPDTSGNSTKTE